MTIPQSFLTLLLFATSALAADYKPDWFVTQFYQEVSTCRSAIVMPAVKAYMDRGVADKMSEDALRKDVISLLPVFEYTASAACFCAVSEVAKRHDYVSYFGSGDFNARMSILSEHINGEVCGAKLRDAMADLKKKDVREAMRLQ
jgi:hypothetical protein